MSTSITAAEPEAPAIPTVTERLTEVVREALLGSHHDTFVEQIDKVVADVLAELCPPNHLLLSAEVVREGDGGLNTPDGNEPAFDVAILGEFGILHDSLEEERAGMLAFSAELSEAVPDGARDLEQALEKRFQPQRQVLIDKAASAATQGFGPSFFHAPQNPHPTPRPAETDIEKIWSTP